MSSSPGVPKSCGTEIDLKSNPLGVTVQGSCCSVIFPKLEGVITQEKSPWQFRFLVYLTPLSPVQARTSLLTLLWTRIPELDIGDVNQLSPVPISQHSTP